MLDAATQVVGVFDACNLWQADKRCGRAACATAASAAAAARPLKRWSTRCSTAFARSRPASANEVDGASRLPQRRYAADAFNQVNFADVQRIAGHLRHRMRDCGPGPGRACGDNGWLLVPPRGFGGTGHEPGLTMPAAPVTASRRPGAIC